MRFKEEGKEEFLGELYYKYGAKKEDFERFKKALTKYLKTLDSLQTQGEDSLVADALKPLFTELGFITQTKSKSEGFKGKSEIDLVLKKDGCIQVIIEAKRPKSKEFFSANTPNTKALHETILYYFRLRENRNTSLKYIIVTDFYRFFIFKARDFEVLFYENKDFKNLYKNFIDDKSLLKGNNAFYKEASKNLDKNLEGASLKLNGLFLNLKDIELKKLKDEKSSLKILKPYFKAFSKDFLLGEFNPNDANKLNTNFYNELLYLLGLSEQKVDGKVLILPSPESLQQKGTLYYNILSNVTESHKDMEDLKKGMLNENVLQILIIWINRILFLKLLESSLIRFNGDKNLAFLTTTKIETYDRLNDLFFKVLAITKENRNSQQVRELDYIPYLNSSLFTRDEKELIEMSALDNAMSLEYFNSTQIKDTNGKKKHGEVNWLEYLFTFLDSFDFGDSNNESELKEDKELINSSVLGLVFEKLNGYKEGSFYTPSFITSYMSKEALEKVVIDKFNKTNPKWNALYLEHIKAEIKEEIQEEKKSTRSDSEAILAKHKATLGSIRICDPAVGSGHFLVSALNTMIEIYSTLGLLSEADKITAVNDELEVIYNHSKTFIYKRPENLNDPRQKIQEELFNLKKDIIENNLFGVDINPNSAAICRLRLWIELLKSSYYQSLDSTYHDLNTLPNIDINIKCGNSLVANIDTSKTTKSLLKDLTTKASQKRDLLNYEEVEKTADNLKRKFKEQLAKYKEAVYNYKNETDKGINSLIKEDIKKSKEFILSMFKEASTESVNFKYLLTNYLKSYGYSGIDNVSFDGIEINSRIKDKLNDYVKSYNLYKIVDTRTKCCKVDKKVFDALIKSMDIYETFKKRDSFEWRFEFPEVLDSDGNFIGFDLVIGNPPYIRQEALKDLKDALKNYQVFNSTSDIYTYFYEAGFNILAEKGILSFITSNKWCRAKYGEKLREFLLRNTTLLIYADFNGVKVFDSATVDTSTLSFQKGHTKANYNLKYINPTSRDISTSDTSNISISNLNKEAFIFSDTSVYNLKAKIESKGTSLKDWDISINYGIKTGYNKAFIIDTAKKDEILNACKSEVERKATAEIIKPILRGRDIKRYSYNWAGLWIICTFPAFKLDIDFYPSLKSYLESFRPRIDQSGEKDCRKKTSNKWFETQDNIAYYGDFARQKIVYSEIVQEPQFCLDSNEGFFAEATSFILVGSNLEYLLGLLHSKLATFAFKRFYAGGGLGEKGYRYKKVFLELLPVPKPDSINQALCDEVIALVDQILESKKQDINADTSELEKTIDSIVYKLYGLDEKDIKVIES
ncbi:Eco57I restriction-modification methylase domain-containing protein [Helicobacter sp. 11S02629-2]|uniref:type IIG restriction enzyme/methyltransferase n=1 Tax=Helicobacter sp. 11S02629-2 TaxID=1476195 RepID=UPI000BA65E22|nr:Eco57I restriction-modification methylase domain-containing protein [Helicobacter sp. 11S02629-2]PAF45610.1 hypothetical protein BKH40_01645 [Helicobacter sp. 11S02629-2]